MKNIMELSIRGFSPIAYLLLSIACTACDVQHSREPTAQAEQQAIPKENEKLNSLKARKLVFVPGTYAKGTIPKGEYIFISENGGYYSEERNGQILDNANLSSFGYVYNHAVGDVTTQGILVSQEGLKEMGFPSAKSLYESVTKQENYNFSGSYKVGIDIPAGSYTIESAGEAYVEINRGPIGNGEILSNANFNGTKLVNLRNGQYITLQKATIVASPSQVEQPTRAEAPERAQREIGTAMQDPRKVRLMECIGVNPWKVKPDGWISPTVEECDQLKQVLSAESDAQKNANQSN